MTSASVVAHETAQHEGSKALGAFYTPPQIAEFLVWWALRSPTDTVLDPSFGGGVFLQMAAARIAELTGSPREQVCGVEINAEVHGAVTAWLVAESGLSEKNLIQSDFFEVNGAELPHLDAVVGNPPFIRYQRFTGLSRERALAAAKRHGVGLSRLTNSWAPFLVHGAAMLNDGGRLAMVVPMEIDYATYARPVLAYLSRSFARVTFLTFRKKLFPDLSEDTLLLLAEDRGDHRTTFVCRELSSADQLDELRAQGSRVVRGARRIDAEAMTEGTGALTQSLIPRKAADLYRELKGSSQTCRLGDLAEVGIGYVTGSNDYFHLGPLQAAEWGIPESLLVPAVRRGRSLRGLRFTKADWTGGLASGDTGYLLSIDGHDALPEAVTRYLAHGQERGIHRAYKCRKRSPWYSVPHVYVPDAFLTYMSGAAPKLVANAAGAVAPNSLHIVRMRSDQSVTGQRLAALWQNSLTRLSAEIEGHALGGGMLKLEPKEAANVLLANVRRPGMAGLGRELDRLCRKQGPIEAQRLADKEELQKGMGLSEGDCRLLRSAVVRLVNRRYRKER